MNDNRPTIILAGFKIIADLWIKSQPFITHSTARIWYATEDLHLEGFCNQVILLLPDWERVITKDIIQRIINSNNIIIEI